MKLNLPVTGHELEVPPGEILVSQTDLRGVITYANTTFAEVSGYTLEELVGASHNIVRHPDMPQRVFDDMWRAIARGNAWRGRIKNRRKNGDHYWTDALVLPMIENGVPAGYLSVRRRASPEDIAESAHQYARLSSGALGGAGRRRFRLDRWLSIRSGIAIGTILVMALLLAGAAVGVQTMGRAERTMGDIQSEAVEATNAISRIKFLMADSRAQVMLGTLHDPRNPLSVTHDHPPSQHLDQMAANYAETEGLWKVVRSRLTAGPAVRLADRFWESRMNCVTNGMQPALEALANGDYAGTGRILAGSVNPFYGEANARADELLDHVRKTAAQRIDEERAHFSMLRTATAASLVAVLLAAGMAGFLFLRGVVKPLEDRIGDLKRMADGNLTARIAVDGGGEIGRLNQAFAITQAQLQCLLDHLSQGVTRVSAESARLKKLTLRLNDGIDEQHARIHRLAEHMDDARATATALSARAEEFMTDCEHTATAMERSATAGGPERIDDAAHRGRCIADTALEIATDSRVLMFLGEEMARDMARVTDFLVDHREAMHCLWGAASALAASAADLEQSANRFEIG